jgi:hypothetical protein
MVGNQMSEDIKDTSTLWSVPFSVRCRVVITPPNGMRVGENFADILNEMVADALRLYGIEAETVMVSRGRELRSVRK